jgi:hypothetical protein
VVPHNFSLAKEQNAMNAIRYLPFVGRLLIGLPFVMSGLSKLAAYGPTTEMIDAVGLPAPPLAFAVAVAVELGGGLLLIAGFQTRLVASALALFSLVTAVVPQQLRRSESDDPLPQERDDSRRPASDRRLRRGCDQCRQPPIQGTRGYRARRAGWLIRPHGPCSVEPKR